MAASSWANWPRPSAERAGDAPFELIPVPPGEHFVTPDQYTERLA